MEMKVRMVPASPKRTRGWEPQQQLCPRGFYHFYGHLDQGQGAHSPSCSCRMGEGKALPTSQEPENPHNSKGSSEGASSGFKKGSKLGKAFSINVRYIKIHTSFFPHIFSGKT